MSVLTRLLKKVFVDLRRDECLNNTFRVCEGTNNPISYFFHATTYKLSQENV